MKGGNEEEKSAMPMFPRLHVSDADKGGPRAPPRNKMSLYEQLSIASHKLCSANLPTSGSVAPSESSLQERTHDRIAYSLFLPHSTPLLSAEKPYLQSSDETIKFRGMESDRSTDRVDCTFSHAAISNAAGSTFNVHDASVKHFLKTKSEDDDDDDFRVPTLVHSEGLPHSKGASLVVVNRPTSFGANNLQQSTTLDSSVHVLGSSRKPILEDNASGKLSKHEIIHGEHESTEVLSNKEHEDEFPNLSVGEILTDPSKYSVVPSDRRAEIKMKFFVKEGYQSTKISNEPAHYGSILAVKSSNDSEFHENINTSNMLSESSSGASSGYSQGSYDEKASRSGELKYIERTGEVSELSMIDSTSGMEFSPDDVVGVIGTKQFWKARREIVNQQRVFAIQVFELHRLIKVQKLFAASPRLFFDDSHFVTTQSQVSTKCFPITSSLNYHSTLKPSSLVEKPAVFTLQTQERNSTYNHDQLPRSIPHSTNPTPIPLPLDNRPRPWSFHPPPNQWLVPVMSPSEGLIYKPYVGPCLPNSGFMAPFYGSCGPSSMPSVTGNFMNTPYGVPLSNQQQNCVLPGSLALDPNCFSTPSMDQVIAASRVEQVSPLTNARSNAQPMQLPQSSYNTSIAKTVSLTSYPPKNDAFKDGEVHASTASSHCDMARGGGGDMLPLFHIASAKERSCQLSHSCDKEHETRAIRVVPHNARSATESAARIFKSIQEERQQPYL